MTEKGTRVRFLIFSWMVMAMAAWAYPLLLHAGQGPADAVCNAGYIWTIEKTACTNEVTMALGQQLQINYLVTVDATLGNESDPNIDTQVNVYDTNKKPRLLGTACVEETPKEFTYSVLIGPYCKCGDYEVCNTALFVTCDTRTMGSSDWTITVHVPCDETCTLTHGYWKTHSIYGPAPYDDTWAMVDPNGEDSAFFDTGQSWYEVLWTQGQDDGNVYYVLAHDYMAAVLNELNGASVPGEVIDAMEHAEVLLDEYDGDPQSMEVLKQKDAMETRRDFIETAQVLNDYNNGGTGPGKCTD
jgi:hypothetical protein